MVKKSNTFALIKNLHPTRSADILVNGIIVGYLGQIHPTIINQLDADKPVYGAEIYYTRLEKLFNTKIAVKPISKFPIVERDLAVIIDNNVACADIVNVIKKAGGNYLESVKLFDIYQGAQVSQGKKSMAFSLVFVAEDKTLNVEEVDAIIKKILKSLNHQLGAELR